MMQQIRDIILLEQLAHFVQNALKIQERGDTRDRIVAQLAQLDQIIAERKDRFDSLDKDICACLES